MKETLTILHSNDLHSQFDAWVHLEGAAQRLRRELGNDRILRVDAGDFQDRSNTLTEATRGVANMDLLTAAGVDAMTCGNNELLVWPTAHLSHLASSAPFPVLAAGLRYAGGRPIPGLQETVVLQRAGLKIGLFGLSLNKSRFLEGLGLALHDPELAAAESVALLRARGCDLVICLSHLGYERDRQVAERAPGIDVIVGGHSHTALPQGDRVGDTIIVQAGGFGEYLGRLDLTLTDGVVTQWQASLLDTAREEPDADTVQRLATWETKAQAVLNEVVAYLPAALPHDPLGESPLAELLAQGLMAKLDAEAAMVHGGVLLSGLPAGPVTFGDLQRICPCNLNPTLISVAGQKLLELLALPVEAFAQPAGRNGMRGNTVAGRIFGLGLEKIDPGRIYRVACNDYLAMGCGPFTLMRGAATDIRFERR